MLSTSLNGVLGPVMPTACNEDNGWELQTLWGVSFCALSCLMTDSATGFANLNAWFKAGESDLETSDKSESLSSTQANRWAATSGSSVPSPVTCYCWLWNPATSNPFTRYGRPRS